MIWGCATCSWGIWGRFRWPGPGGLPFCGDFGLNLYNSRSMNAMRALGLASATVSFEMTLPQIGICPRRSRRRPLSMGGCPHGDGKLSDSGPHRPVRLPVRHNPPYGPEGEEFPVIRDCGTCRSLVLNGKKLYWLDRREDWSGLGLYALRLLFTTENPQEVDRVLRAWETAAPFAPGGCTRGCTCGAWNKRLGGIPNGDHFGVPVPPAAGAAGANGTFFFRPGGGH